MNRHSLGWAVQREHGELLYQKVAPYILGVVMFAIFLLVGNIALGKQEKKDCLKWKSYETMYPDFKVSEAINEQCYNYGINFKP